VSDVADRQPSRDILLRPRPLPWLLVGSLLCALAFCADMFGPGFLAGTSPYWHAPEGVRSESSADTATALSGYYYFVRDAWTLPLFQATKLGAPDGVNIVFTDSIPLVALLGRLLYRLTGQTINLYGAWTALCFVGSALSMTGLVAALGQRGVAAALMATVSGLCMPALLARWGHMSLMAQWEIPLAFVLYVASRRSRRAIGLATLSFLLATAALWTSAYLFVMVIGILAAALAQATLDRRLRFVPAASIGALFAAGLLGLILLSGLVTGEGGLSATGFGTYSLNLLSPIVPQNSTLFPFLGNRLAEGTGGQYEGFSYVGAGLLLLLFATWPWLRAALAVTWRRHVCLLGVLAAFTLFAMSNRIELGVLHVATIPLPHAVLALAGLFRASGRFVWPGLYVLTAAVIVAAPSCLGRAAGVLLVVAAMAQAVDTTQLRAALAARVAVAADMPLPELRWAGAIRQHDFLRVEPPFLCLSDPDGLALHAALELQLLASRENVATNTVYATRHRQICTPPDAAPLVANELRVYLLSDRRPAALPDSGVPCGSSATIAVCSRRLGGSGAAALVAGPP
jgi:hypothetical protein